MAERKFAMRMVEQEVAGSATEVKEKIREAEANVKHAMNGLRHIESHPEVEF
jgi:hypothetical protein